MLWKSCLSQVKAAGPDNGLKEGQFEALVSVFGNVDSYGDVVMPGAFSKSLAAWAEKGDPIPVYYSHQMSDPFACIGEVVDAKETDEGLLVRAQLDIEDVVSGSKAPQVYRLLKGRRITQFSFAYDIVKASWGERSVQDEEGNTKSFEVYELHELALHEVGPTPLGANRETELLAVKTAGEHAARLAEEMKSGRVLSAKNENVLREAAESLKTAGAHITDVLSQLEESKSGQAGKEGKAIVTSPAMPSPITPAERSALLEIMLAGA